MPKKNSTDKINRMAFVQLCVDNPKEGEKSLKRMASKLGKCKNTNETLECLSDIMFISQSTLYRDLGLY